MKLLTLRLGTGTGLVYPFVIEEAASRRGRSSFLTTQSICNTHAVCVIIERRSQEMESNRPVPAKNNLN